jgi:hypothetical protein
MKTLNTVTFVLLVTDPNEVLFRDFMYLTIFINDATFD